MFESSSRYSSLETATCTLPDGRIVAYEEMDLLVEVTVTEGDRLDLIAARTLGDPEIFWRVCDANDAMNPFDLVEDSEIGHKVRVPIPQA
jgi:hypothetical protein